MKNNIYSQKVELLSGTINYFIVKVIREYSDRRIIEHFGCGSSVMDAEKYTEVLFEREEKPGDPEKIKKTKEVPYKNALGEDLPF